MIPIDPRHQEYNDARNFIDDIIGEHSKQISKNLDTIAKIRSEEYYKNIDSWLSYLTKKKIDWRPFINISDLNQKLNKAQARYARFSLYYRFGYSMVRNINFIKILSFEISLMQREAVLSPIQKINLRNYTGSTREKLLFHLNPLLSYVSYRIVDEVIVRLFKGDTEKPDAIRENIDDIHNLHILIEKSMMDFAVNVDGRDIMHDDFREFVKSPNQENFTNILLYISKHNPNF
jgi:hypothetical protein